MYITQYYLLILQNKLLKLLTNRNRRYSTNQLHTDLDILKIKHIYETSVLLFVHECIRDTPIEPFRNYFILRGDTHNHNLRNNDNLASNQIRTNKGADSTHTVGAKLWNDIPKNITDIEERSTFKTEICNLFKKKYQVVE